MSQRDDDFARLAAEYAAADADVIEAERMANQAIVKVNAARTDRDNLKKKLAGFVGQNIRTRNAVIGYRLVRVEYGGVTERGNTIPAEVTVEDVTFSRGDA